MTILHSACMCNFLNMQACIFVVMRQEERVMNENTAVMTGFEGLDKVLGGYRAGTLNAITGGP